LLYRRYTLPTNLAPPEKSASQGKRASRGKSASQGKRSSRGQSLGGK